MNEPFISEFVVRLVCEIAERLIRWIATETGADDLAFLLLCRVRQGCFPVIAAAGRLIWASFEDRCIGLYFLCASVDPSLLAIRSMMTALEYESAFYFFGFSAVVTAVGFFIAPLTLFTHVPFWRSAIVVAAGLGSVLAMSKIARSIHEDSSLANSGMTGGTLAIAGAVGVGIVVHDTGWYGAAYCGVSMLSWFLGLVVVSRLRDSVEAVQHEYLVTRWGPGGRPYTKRIVKTQVRAIVRNQWRRRRSGSLSHYPQR